MSIKVLKVLYRGANAKFMRQRLCLPRFSFDKPQYEKELNLEILFYRYMEMVGTKNSSTIVFYTSNMYNMYLKRFNVLLVYYIVVVFIHKI